MARISGLGGYIEVYDADTELLIGAIHNTDYEIDIEGRIDEATDSGSVGFEEGEPIIAKVNSVTFTCIDKDDSYPELLGLEPNARITLLCKRGESSDFDSVLSTIVRNLRKSNPQTALRRITVTCEYGSYIAGAP